MLLFSDRPDLLRARRADPRPRLPRSAAAAADVHLCAPARTRERRVAEEAAQAVLLLLHAPLEHLAPRAAAAPLSSRWLMPLTVRLS